GLASAPRAAAETHRRWGAPRSRVAGAVLDLRAESRRPLPRFCPALGRRGRTGFTLGSRSLEPAVDTRGQPRRGRTGRARRRRSAPGAGPLVERGTDRRATGRVRFAGRPLWMAARLAWW